MSTDDSTWFDSASAATDYELFDRFLDVVTLVLGLGVVVALAEGYATRTLAPYQAMWVLLRMYVTLLAGRVIIRLFERQ